MRYVTARLSERRRENTYRNYICDTLFYFTQEPRQYMTLQYRDLLKPIKNKDKKTAEEIVQEVIKNAGLVVE